ncbi:MAG: nitroreductase/quinone reductase family protein [Chloroflexota bacterium]
MNDDVRTALEQDRLIDITTIGRKSGKPSRKEIVFHNVDGTIYITGMPGKRDWYANMLENPEFTFHLKQSTEADLLARATPITDEGEKRRLLPPMLESMNRSEELDRWVADSPLVKVELIQT